MTTQPTIALCGAGMIAGVHALAAQQLGFPVVFVASRDQQRATRRARELGCRVIDYGQLPGGADIVIVATPPALHFDHAVQALERQAAVIVEKPLVTTLNEADRLVMIAERHGNRLLYAENLLFAPSVQTLMSRIPDCGPLSHISLRAVQSAPTWGGFLKPGWGGGVLFDLGVHPLALAILIGRQSGAGEVVAVQARLRGEGTDTDAVVTLTYANGLTANVHASWEGGDVANWDVQLASSNSALRLELLPTISLEHNGDAITLPAAHGPHPFIEQLGYVNQLRLAATAFNHSVAPTSDVRFGRWLMEIVCAAYVSASQGSQRVEVPSNCDRHKTPRQLWKGEN
jgi:predicted dehydrogenase